MKKSAVVLLGIGLGVGAYWTFRALAKPHVRVDLKSEDLDYQDIAPEVIASEHLIDLNEADREELEALGLGSASLERLIESRPYRSKLELVSRMVLTDAEYTGIREKIAVSKGRDPVKVA
jgi:DNA uptake protein ComE-like DNA-binding protein